MQILFYLFCFFYKGQTRPNILLKKKKKSGVALTLIIIFQKLSTLLPSPGFKNNQNMVQMLGYPKQYLAKLNTVLLAMEDKSKEPGP